MVVGAPSVALFDLMNGTETGKTAGWPSHIHPDREIGNDPVAAQYDLSRNLALYPDICDCVTSRVRKVSADLREVLFNPGILQVRLRSRRPGASARRFGAYA